MTLLNHIGVLPIIILCIASFNAFDLFIFPETKLINWNIKIYIKRTLQFYLFFEVSYWTFKIFF